jgi:hypothetical protein
MRKAFVVSIVAAAAFGIFQAAHALDLVVLSPTAGQLFASGDAVEIRWAEAAPIGQEWVPAPMSVSVLKGGATVLQLGASAAGATSWMWLVPAGLQGDDYQIRVVNTVTSETAVSAEFSINPHRFTPKSFGPFSQTTGRYRWKLGEAVTLTWEPTPGWAQPLEFHVVATNGLRAWLAGTAASSAPGAATFTVPASIIPGTYYIEVREAGALPHPCPDAAEEEDQGHCIPEPFRYEYLYRTEPFLNVYTDPGPYPDGAVLREASSPHVWIIKVLPNGRQFKRHVITPAMASWYGHWGDFWSSVRVVPDGTMDDYTLSAWIRLPLTANRETWKIYEVNADMTKHWIRCPEYDDCPLAWFEHGGEEAGVYTVNTTELNAYTTSADVFITTREVEHDHGAPVH